MKFILNKNFLLNSLLIIFILFNGSLPQFFKGESGLIEIIQVLLIILNIFLIVRSRVILRKSFNKWIINIKIFLLFFLLYEELSILTKNTFVFLEKYSIQSELNFHNARLINQSLGTITIINNDSINILPLTFITIGITTIIGFGNYLNILNKFSFLFFEKKFAIYSLTYTGNYFFSYLLRPILSMHRGFLLNHEFVELFLYLILTLDSIEKIKNTKYTK